MNLHPNLTQRPEHVDPNWWARIPWSTRRRRALERVGRPDLIAGFERLRKFERRAA